MAYIKKRFVKDADSAPEGQTAGSLREFALNNGIRLEPLDVASLARQMGISIRYEPLEDNISGSLKKDRTTRKWVITVNSLHHPHRQRFTIAHELAHYCLDSTSKDDFTDKVFFRNELLSKEEKIANRYAAELLMPEPEFRRQVEISPKVEDIAQYFQVSSAAVVFRARELGYKGGR